MLCQFGNLVGSHDLSSHEYGLLDSHRADQDVFQVRVKGVVDVLPDGVDGRRQICRLEFPYQRLEQWILHKLHVFHCARRIRGGQLLDVRGEVGHHFLLVLLRHPVDGCPHVCQCG